MTDLGEQEAPRAGLATWLSLVKFGHSVFALPFALIALLVATDGRPPLRTLGLVVVAAVCARTAAMAFNRWADRHIDAANPRTAGRELPRGAVRPAAALALALGAAGAFVLSAWALSPLCLTLSPVVLVVLFGYSFTKRFTWASHAVLGLALGLAPLGAWIAATGSLAGDLRVPLLLAAAVLCWVAGFDLIYSCQDEAFDRGLGLASFPARFGLRAALAVSALLHVATVALLVAVGQAAELHWLWGLGVAAGALLLLWEHSIVSPTDLSRVDAAFFTANGLLSLILALLAGLDLWILH